MPWLLSMIHDPHGQLITHPVPTSTNMITNMRSRMLPSGSEHSQEFDQLHANSRVRSRIMDSVPLDSDHHTLCPAGAWRHQLSVGSYRRAASRPAYRRAFFKLMVELDATTFGDQFYSQLDVDSILPPTEAEVIAKMVLSAGERPVLPP
ncbi:hypothetical protein PSTT_10690 [Puccinia striiformis]|uniref:Uncharacterized protein n=1 Tax=Puccinia striiformis TaxID=27350 RepID=A0A2S4V3F8_9BASI|nr:hypothetical protein PSTT_10690 [Puccinia striiformis]